MLARSLRGLLLLCLGTCLVGCGNPSGLDAVQISSGTESLPVGQTAQFTATGTYGNASHPTTQDVTSVVSWSSSTPAVATVSSTGLVTAVAAGTTTITASATAFNGPTSSSATLTVTANATATNSGSLLSLTIIPSDMTVGRLQDTGQFLAIGTFSTAPFIRDLTNSPKTSWYSAAPNVFPVNTNAGGNKGATAGIVTAYGNGTVTITAEASNPDNPLDKSIQTATATFSCPLVLPNPPTTPGSCYSGLLGPLLTTLTVYNEGLDDTDWYVSGPSASGTPDVLHCGPGSPYPESVCTATYPPNPSVPIILKATGGSFGGWSTSTCTPVTADGAPTDSISSAGPNYCKVNFNAINVTVGAIFDRTHQ